MTTRLHIIALCGFLTPLCAGAKSIESVPGGVKLGRFDTWSLDEQGRARLGIHGEVRVEITLLRYKGSSRLPALAPAEDLQNQLLVDMANQIVQGAFQQAVMGSYPDAAEALGYLAGTLYEATKKPLGVGSILAARREKKGPARLLVTIPSRRTAVRFRFVPAPKKRKPINW